MKIQGVIFDLDGTLVDSALNFALIRRDLQLPTGQPILEALDEMPPGPRRNDCRAILRDHELRGAERATLMPGVDAALGELARQNRSTAVLTRNSREATDLMLDRLDLSFSVVLTREDAAPKPDPAGLLQVCANWGVSGDRVCFVGDYLFDLQAGQRAGIPSVLYMPDSEPEFADVADFRIRHFDELVPLISQMETPI